MTKENFLKSNFGKCDFLTLTKGWLFFHENKPMYISDYKLSNILKNSPNPKNDIINLAQILK